MSKDKDKKEDKKNDKKKDKEKGKMSDNEQTQANTDHSQQQPSAATPPEPVLTAAVTEQPTISLTQEEIIMMKKLLQSLCGFCGNQATGTGEPHIIYKDKMVEKIVTKEVKVPVEVVKEVIKEVIKRVEVPVEVIKEVVKLPQHSLFDLLAMVRKDADFNRDWLGDTHNDLDALVKLTASMSQWERVEGLWDSLASRCRQQKRALTADEQTFLTQAVHTYNLTRANYKASLITIDAGISYDYETQQQGNHTGDKVKATWLAGLKNAGGQLVRKPLVETY